MTDGAKYALYLLFQAILNVGDEVIIPVPYWVSYGEQVKLAEGKPVFVSSTQEQSFKVSVAQLEAVRTDKTKAIILNSPSTQLVLFIRKKNYAKLVNGQLLIISSLLQMIFMAVWCTMDIGSHQLQPSQKQFVNRQSLLMVFPKHMQ